MASRKCALVAAALIVFSFTVASTASAAGPECYTLSSLQGSYSVVNTYGANVALGIQAEVLDGRGNLTRTGILNQPTVGSTTGARTIGVVTSVGTYTVNCDGSGTITRLVTRPDGTTATATDDFLITEASRVSDNSSTRYEASTVLEQLQEAAQARFNRALTPGELQALFSSPGVNYSGTGTVDGAQLEAALDLIGRYSGNPADPFAGGVPPLPRRIFIATRIVDIQQAPSVIVPGGIFLTRVHTRRPSSR
jgi:hypothetical protein